MKVSQGHGRLTSSPRETRKSVRGPGCSCRLPTARDAAFSAEPVLAPKNFNNSALTSCACLRLCLSVLGSNHPSVGHILGLRTATDKMGNSGI
jgi:hypothetical protein